MIRDYQTQVLVEALRRLGLAQGVEVVDLRWLFAEANNGQGQSLFCDDIHLTDEGNKPSANFIADQISSNQKIF